MVSTVAPQQEGPTFIPVVPGPFCGAQFACSPCAERFTSGYSRSLPPLQTLKTCKLGLIYFCQCLWHRSGGGHRALLRRGWVKGGED